MAEKKKNSGPLKKKRKTEKGILGVPKKKTLFSFNVRHGEEWSSDSEDSDYVPDEEITTFSKKRKSVRRENKGDKKKGKEQRAVDSSSVKNAVDKSSKVSLCLPDEILLKIFHEVVNSEGSLPFLVRASKVCSAWRDLASDPSLWKKVDLSFGWIKLNDRVLKWLCENRLTQCRDINISDMKFFTNSNIKFLTESLQHLQAINLSRCKITAETVLTVAENCNKLSALDVSFTPVDAVSLNTLKVLLPKHGSFLKLLNLGGNSYKAFNAVFNLILNHCPLLEMLDISNCLFSTDIVLINVRKFQAACPNLQILGLANSRIDCAHDSQLSSFPKLEQLSVAFNKPGDQPRSCLSLDLVTRILNDSPDLKLLDLRGNDNIDCYNLCNISCDHVQSLHASNTATQRDGSQYERLALLFRKWRRSLTELDLSWSTLKAEDLNHAFKALVDIKEKSSLSKLNLAGTNITEKTMSLILNKCEHLKDVNLTSCRGMTRGFKRQFHNRTQVKKLCQELSELDSQESD